MTGDEIDEITELIDPHTLADPYFSLDAALPGKTLEIGATLSIPPVVPHLLTEKDIGLEVKKSNFTLHDVKDVAGA